MLRRLICSTASLVVAGAALVACAPVPTGPTLVTDGDTFAIVSGPASGGMDALLTGRIEVDDNQCWAIRSEADDALIHVLWPHGTDFLQGERDVDGLDVPGHDRPYGPGGRVEVGGGEATADGDQVPCWEHGELVWVMS
jgi:hypothetical protein